MKIGKNIQMHIALKVRANEITLTLVEYEKKLPSSKYLNGDNVRAKPAPRPACREAHHGWGPGARLGPRWDPGATPLAGVKGTEPPKLLDFSVLKAQKIRSREYISPIISE